MLRILPLIALTFAGCSQQPVAKTLETKPEQAKPAEPKPTAVPWTLAMQTIANGNTAFACDLYAQLRTEPGNLFISPFSIHTALAMTSEGAQGDTLAEMVKVLHLPADAAARVAAGDVARHYAVGGEGYELAVSNRLWGQEGYPWKADFLDRLRTRYAAPLTEVDFKDDAKREAARLAINADIEKQTKDRIKELLHANDLTRKSRLVLTNAIYFKGQWKTAFDKKMTKDATFTRTDWTKLDVPTMHTTDEFRYAETDEAQVLEMPYKGDSLSMVVVLPKTIDGLPELEKKLTTNGLAGWIVALKDREVRVDLPRLRSESRFQLAEMLKKLGMPLAFDQDMADLTGIANPPDGMILYISKVIHQSFVEVSEEGTEAAAATAVVGNVASSAPLEPPLFRADHPFLYLIRDTKTGTILFLGRYAGP